MNHEQMEFIPEYKVDLTFKSQCNSPHYQVKRESPYDHLK